METRELICIGCPLGCPLTVRLDGEHLEISGNTCKRGEDYARKEVQNPTRIVTSTVRVTGGDVEMVSVKTKEDIPKDKIFACMDEIHRAAVTAPVHIGDVIIPDCAGTGIPVIAIKEIAAI
ncbi:MAG: DUF1667 domain-containing protein [Clostridium sp.]|nr:DUF1667 domain-containing protein [Clostridium sp.]